MLRVTDGRLLFALSIPHDESGHGHGLRWCGMSKASLIKHSVRIAGHPTSISLEAPFWDTLREIAARRQQSINALMAAIDAERTGNLSSAIRLFVLESCRRGELADR